MINGLAVKQVETGSRVDTYHHKYIIVILILYI